MSQELTVSQQKLSSRIAKTGSLSKFELAKSAYDFNKIRTIPKDDLSYSFAFLFVRIANLLGLKEPISDINKQDIKEMILSRFGGLSLEEVDYAFKLERYGEYDERTHHYQLFNAEYVSTILNKYKKWLKSIRTEKNITNMVEPVTNYTEEEKERLIDSGVKNCFEQYKKTGDIITGYLWVYDYFFEGGYLPEHNPEFRKATKEKAKLALRKEYMLSGKRKSNLEKAMIMVGSNGKLKNMSKKVVLMEYFNEQIKNE